MNVLHITTNYPSGVFPYSGTFVQVQARALVRLGLKVTVAHLVPYSPRWLGTLSTKWSKYGQIPLGRLEEDGLTVCRIPYLAYPRDLHWGYPDLLMDLALRCSDLLRIVSPDLIHGHFVFPVGAAVIRVADRMGVPSVLTAHGSDVNVYPGLHPTAEEVFIRTVRKAAGVITVSQALNEKIRLKAGVSAVTMPIGVRTTRLYRENVSGAQRLLGLPIDRSYLLYVGNLLREKGLYELLHAFQDISCEIPNVDLIVVGDGPERSALQGLTRQNGLAGRVRFQGAVPHDTVSRWMSASCALVLPSYSEGLPTVIAEAGALGLPVIASAVGGIPELITPNHTGVLIPPKSASDLALALRRVLGDPEWAASMGHRLRVRVRSDYDVDTNASRLQELYRRVLECRKGAH